MAPPDTSTSAETSLVERRNYPDELWLNATCEDAEHFGYRHVFVEDVFSRLRLIQERDPSLFYRGMAQLAVLRVPMRQLEAAIQSAPRSVGDEDLGGHQTLTELLAENIPPPTYLIKDLMHEGMMLLGGKSKRGKSWLMFDLAISIATGRHALRHFPCPGPQPVLYLALEDGKLRLQTRTRLIQNNLAIANNFHIRWNFKPLAQGGTEYLARLIEKYGYGLVVIDVLAKLEPVGSRGEKSYQEVYQMFAPFQELRSKHSFCLAMLTHLRKQEAEDQFENIMGSVGYVGTQDVLWVLERKPKDDFAFLHTRDKDAEDTTHALRFIDGHWEHVGEGESFEVSRDQRKVMKVLQEERENEAGLSIEEIRKACEMPEQRYGYMRKLLVTMVKDDLIHRTSRGRYTATVSGAFKMREPGEDDEEIPF
jgi:hypothetical protein